MPVNGVLRLVYPYAIFGPFPEIIYVGTPGFPICNYWGQYGKLTFYRPLNLFHMKPDEERETENPEPEEQALSPQPEEPMAPTEPVNPPHRQTQPVVAMTPRIGHKSYGRPRAGRKVRERKERAIQREKDLLHARWHISHEPTNWGKLESEFNDEFIDPITPDPYALPENKLV